MSKGDQSIVKDGTGHRARLRQKLAIHDGETLHDHELVEYLLSLAIPRRDTKDLAKALLDEFGGLHQLMAADGDQIQRVSGMGETSVAAIKIVSATMNRILFNELAKQPVLNNWEALTNYLTVEMSYRKTERVRVLHLNARNQLIKDDKVNDGSIDQAAIYTREVIRRSLELGSSAIILVHNHPSGDPTPSRQDLDMTRNIIDAAKKLDILVHDHVIVAGGKFVSLVKDGFL